MTTINLITQFLNATIATIATIAVNVPVNVPVNVTNVTNDMLASRVYFNENELVHGIKDKMVVNWESGSIVVGNCDKGHVFVIHHDRMLWDREYVLERMSMYQAICMVARQMQEYDYALWRDHHCVIEVDGEAFLTCC